MEKVRVLSLSFALVNVADYITTVEGINHGFHELNSLVASLTPGLFLMLKILIVSSITALIMLTCDLRKRNVYARGVYVGLIAGMGISTVVIAVIAAHNALLLVGFPEIEIVTRIFSNILI
ncbi:DUF5658 family protein [Archaeoglobus neptunius]|uniref:DUF5658 family protein n=1 Tax=Archaeoglobus neptunius TaxID=2798580 RepID=UPI0019290571|nr:DUF5658 family protein [Archaeoglobus neptunius]